MSPSPNLVPFQVQSPPKTNTTWDCQNWELGCHEIFYKICWVENGTFLDAIETVTPSSGGSCTPQPREEKLTALSVGHGP